MSTRRKFLFDCSAFTAVAWTVPTALVTDSVATISKARSFREMSCSELAGQMNTTFQIRDSSGKTIKATLAEVKPRPPLQRKSGQHPPPDAGNEKFSLIFSGRRDDSLRQDTYSFAHGILGRFDLFIVPIATKNPAQLYYEAVINRPQAHLNDNQTKG